MPRSGGVGPEVWDSRPAAASTIRAVRATERFEVILNELPRNWSTAQLVLTVEREADPERAALVLAPLAPGRRNRTFRFAVAAPGAAGPTVDAVKRAVARLDEESITARISLDEVTAHESAQEETGGVGVSLAAQWDELSRAWPPRWSDALIELELASSDDIDPGALLLAPANPLLQHGTQSFRFRAAQRFGYGISSSMLRRCLERLDERAISGTLSLVRLLSETHPVATQGPVWRIASRSV